MNNLGFNCPCELCSAYKDACKEALTPPENVAEFLINYGNALKEGTVWSSYNWIFTDLCRNYLKNRGL